jgi:hypothetical protein
MCFIGALYVTGTRRMSSGIEYLLAIVDRLNSPFYCYGGHFEK